MSGRVPANDIPWSYPEITKHYKDRVVQQLAVLDDGVWRNERDTFRGAARAVVSKSLLEDCAREAHERGDGPSLAATKNVGLSTTLEGAIALIDPKFFESMFIYGAQLYAAALPIADELDLTLIDRDYEGDVRFPGHWAHRNAWRESDAVEVDMPGAPVFKCVERRQGETPELTFTRWVKR